MCIGYAFRPRLSSRLTRSGRTFLLKPEAFGHYDSHIILATHSGILTSMKSTRASAHASPRMERSPTPTEFRIQKSDVRFFFFHLLINPPKSFPISSHFKMNFVCSSADIKPKSWLKSKHTTYSFKEPLAINKNLLNSFTLSFLP